MDIQIIQQPPAAPPPSVSERETVLRGLEESGLIEPWMLESLIAAPPDLPASKLLQLRNVLDRTNVVAVTKTSDVAIVSAADNKVVDEAVADPDAADADVTGGDEYVYGGAAAKSVKVPTAKPNKAQAAKPNKAQAAKPDKASANKTMIAALGGPGIRITCESQRCISLNDIVRPNPPLHRETGAVDVVGVAYLAHPSSGVEPTAPGRVVRTTPNGGPDVVDQYSIGANYPIEVAGVECGTVSAVTICGLEDVELLHPRDMGAAALALYEAARPAELLVIAEAAAAPAASRWAHELQKLGLPDLPWGMAELYGFLPELRASEVRGVWNARIGEIVEARRGAEQRAGERRTAEIERALQYVVRAHVQQRMFAGRRMNAADRKSLEVEYEMVMDAARNRRELPWQPLLRRMAPELEIHFANAVPGLQDWYRDSGGYPIVCPHVWKLARAGDTLGTHRWLVQNYGQNEEVGSGIVCKICGDRIGLRDRIDYGDIAALAPDREQAELATRVGQLLRHWIEFMNPPDPISMRKIASGLYGAVQPIIFDARRALRRIATLGDEDFAALYEFYSGVAIFAVLVKLIVDNPSRIFSRKVQERRYVSADASTGTSTSADKGAMEPAQPAEPAPDLETVEEQAVEPRPSSNGEIAVIGDTTGDAVAVGAADTCTGADTCTSVDTSDDISIDDDDDNISISSAGTSNGSSSDIIGGADSDIDEWAKGVVCGADEAADGADEAADADVTGGKVQRGPFDTARSWALLAIANQYKTILAEHTDITPEVIANRFDSAYARVTAAITSAKVVQHGKTEHELYDPVADTLAAAGRVSGSALAAPYAGPDAEQYAAAVAALRSRRKVPRDYGVLMGRMGTHLAPMEIRRDVAEMRKTANSEADERKGYLQYVYGSAAHKPPTGSGITPRAGPHIHKWNIMRYMEAGAVTYGQKPRGVFSDKYCSVCGCSWNSIETGKSGASAMAEYYEVISFFNYYAGVCPVLERGHVFAEAQKTKTAYKSKAAAAQAVGAPVVSGTCKCGATRNTLAKRDASYFSKYVAQYRKAIVVARAPPVHPPVQSMKFAPTWPEFTGIAVQPGARMSPAARAALEVGAVQVQVPPNIRKFASSTYGFYAAVHENLRAPQYETICALLGTSYARTWPEHISAKPIVPAELTSPRRISTLRGYAQLLLTSLSIMENYANLPYPPADLEAVASAMSGKIEVPKFRGRSFAEGYAEHRAEPLTFLLDYIFETITAMLGQQRRSNEAWIGHIMGRIISDERAAAQLSEDELAVISGRGSGLVAGEKPAAIAADDEENADDVYDGMDYNGENSKLD